MVRCGAWLRITEASCVSLAANGGVYMTSDLAEVATFENAHVARLVKMKLESEGLEVRVLGNDLEGSAFGRNETTILLVPRTDAERASAIIRACECEDWARDLLPPCPRCGSANVKKQYVTDRPATFLARFFSKGRTVWRRVPRFRCAVCGHSWRA